MTKPTILQRLFGQKFSESRTINSYNILGQYAPSAANYDTFSKQGYEKVVMVYRCVAEIASACKGINWELYSTRDGSTRAEVNSSPLLTLMKKPNPLMGQAQFIEALVSYYLIAGNSFVEAVRPSLNTPPKELWPIFSPQNMKIVVGKEGYPQAYEYIANGNKKRWDVDFVDFKCDVLQLKTFNPTDIWWGLSPLQIGISAIDASNASNMWNISLMKNMCTPSGILSVKSSDSNPTGALTTLQKDDLKEEIERRYSGLRNAGRPMLLEGNLQWQSIALSPKDMDYLKGKEVNAADIALIYGVPLEMVGLGQKTFANYAEARAAFYTNTVLPLMDFIKTELNRWLTPAFGDNLELDYDRDNIEALNYLRQAKLTTLNTVSFLDVNEKRIAAGYEPKEGWDVMVVGSQLVKNPEDLISMDAPIEADPKAPEPTPAPEDVKPEPTDTPLASTAFNGAQVTSLLEVITQVVDGQLPRDAAINIIITAFNVTSVVAEGMLGDVGQGFEPKPAPAADPIGGDPNTTPPKKPVDPNAGPAEDDPEDPTDNEDDNLDDNGKPIKPAKALFKSVNLINAKEKQNSWKLQNAKRKRDAAIFNRALKADFDEMNTKMRAALKNNANPNTLLISTLQVIDQSKPIIAATIAKHIRFTAEDFGHTVLGEGKSLPGVIETKATRKFEQYINDFVKRRTTKAMSEISSTTEKKAHEISRRIIADGINDGDTNDEIADKFMDEFEGLAPARAMAIARTETAIASNAGTQEAAKSLEIPGLEKEWVSANDDRVRDNDHADHASMNGVSIPMDSKFTVPPDADMDGPGDESADASQVVNCRCCLTYGQRVGKE